MTNIPGLPAINIPDVVGLLIGDAISLGAGFLRAPWGLYFGFIPVVLADNVATFGFQQEFDISDYPIENGEFASFNKVYRPFEGMIRFTAGGNLLRRQALLDSIQAIIGSTSLYNIVTEDAVYSNVNPVSYTYQQSAGDGVGLIKVDVKARQVKTTGPAVTSIIPNPIDPGASAQVNSGAVQPLLPNKSASIQIGSITGSASAPNG